MSNKSLGQTTTKAGTEVKKHDDLFTEGDRLYWKCEYEKAKQHFQSLLNQSSISRLDSARCYSSLGAANTKLQCHEEALDNYCKRLDILRKLTITNQTERDIVKCYMSIGMVYSLKQDYVQAIDYYKQALTTLSNAAVNLDLTSKIYKNLANLYTKTNEFDLAIMYFEKAIELDRQHLREDHLKFGQTYTDMGTTYYCKQDYTQALSYFLKARKSWSKTLPSSHMYIESLDKTIVTVQSKLSMCRLDLRRCHGI